MSKSKIISFVVLVAVIVIAGWRLNNLSNDLTTASLSTPEEIVEEEQNTASVVIDDGLNLKSFELEINGTTTAFDMLQKAASSSGMIVQSSYYEGMGVMIEIIGDKKNGDDDKYWLYYVNGEMPMVAADQTMVAPNDQIEFRFENSSL